MYTSPPQGCRGQGISMGVLPRGRARGGVHAYCPTHKYIYNNQSVRLVILTSRTQAHLEGPRLALTGKSVGGCGRGATQGAGLLLGVAYGAGGPWFTFSRETKYTKCEKI